MTLRTSAPRARRRWTALAIIVAAGLLVATSVALGNLAGSQFNTDDGNLVAQAGDPNDWGNTPECNGTTITTNCESRKADQPTGSGDDSFTQGTKEDTEEPVTETGSIPPNKSDLKNFGIYVEETAGGKFVHMFWTRVQEPNGTTNMDFEFNQGSALAANGVTPLRTADDLLVVYELSRGGTVPNLALLEWNEDADDGDCDASNAYPCWGDRIDLDEAGAATGSINEVAIASDDADGLGALSARTFGEATIDLDFIFDEEKCTSFGSAYLKSRSSDSFTSALKDFIAPLPVNITNCAKVIIRKTTDPADGEDFGFAKSFTTDPSSLDTFTLDDGESITFNNVVLGTGYTVDETSLPTGWDFDSVDCTASTGVTPSFNGSEVTFALDDTDDILDCTYTNVARGTIVVEKEADAAGSFDFTSGTLTSPFTLTTTGAGDANGDSATFSDLIPGTYDVAESVPAGWSLTSATCDDGSDPASIGLDAGETVTCTFVNERNKGAILISKDRKHAADGPGDHPHAGVIFTVSGGELDSEGITAVTDADGEACVDGLILSSFVGDYTVTETVPAGYVSADDAQDVTVDIVATCDDVPYVGNTVAFSNMPLTDITVTVDSQVDGGTASTIECVLDTTTVGTGATDTNGDGELTLEDLEPGTYICTIVVDP
jgi:hypothetical protein